MIKGIHKDILTSDLIQLALIFNYKKGGRCILDVQMKIKDLDFEIFILETVKEAVKSNLDIKQIQKILDKSEYFTDDFLDGYTQVKGSKARIIKKIQTEIEECIDVRDSIKYTMVNSYNQVTENTKEEMTTGRLEKIANQIKN
jgi:uncharacterized protein YeeX (DUF496 family)